jgi:hypothetical protein
MGGMLSHGYSHCARSKRLAQPKLPPPIVRVGVDRSPGDPMAENILPNTLGRGDRPNESIGAESETQMRFFYKLERFHQGNVPSLPKVSPLRGKSSASRTCCIFLVTPTVQSTLERQPL